MTSKLELWLSSFTSEETRYGRKSFLRIFLRALKRPSEDLESEVERYLAERENDIQAAQADVNAFWVYANEHYAPTSIRQHMSTLRTFLRDHNIEFKSSFWQKFIRRRRVKPRPIQQDHIPTTAELRKIFSHLPIQGKAFFSILASAGTRITETTLIRFSEIDLDEVPARITFRAEATKSGVSRTVFISDESVEYVREWIKVRQEWIDTATMRCDNTPMLHFKADARELFPFGDDTARYYWERALRNA
ncbi:MAG: tyrosine-type recombinase/integrase [Candidatus Thorarchaeota archaeon]